jgi:hypothetical protein
MLDYLERQGMSECVAAFEQEGKVSRSQIQPERHAQLLEKKWTSVVRLQRKVYFLSAQSLIFYVR